MKIKIYSKKNYHLYDGIQKKKWAVCVCVCARVCVYAPEAPLSMGPTLYLISNSSMRPSSFKYTIACIFFVFFFVCRGS